MSAVDWHAVPGPVGWYEPDSVGSALRELAAATSVLEASAPSSVLYNTGLLHEHSGTVYPAAASARPPAVRAWPRSRLLRGRGSR